MTIPNSCALGAGAAGTANTQMTCAAVFHPKVWTYTAASRKTEFSEFPSTFAGLAVPALPFFAAPVIYSSHHS